MYVCTKTKIRRTQRLLRKVGKRRDDLLWPMTPPVPLSSFIWKEREKERRTCFYIVVVALGWIKALTLVTLFTYFTYLLYLAIIARSTYQCTLFAWKGATNFYITLHYVVLTYTYSRRSFLFFSFLFFTWLAKERPSTFSFSSLDQDYART